MPGSRVVWIVVLTGLAFCVGAALNGLAQNMPSLIGFARYQEFGPRVTVVIMLGVLLQAVVGCTGLAWLMREFYPPVRMWLIGVTSVVLGTLLPVAAAGGWYLVFLPLAGVLVGALLGVQLRRRGPGPVTVAVLWCFLGYLAASAALLAGGGLFFALAERLYESTGVRVEPWLSVMTFPSFLMGAGMAMGVVRTIAPRNVNRANESIG